MYICIRIPSHPHPHLIPTSLTPLTPTHPHTFSINTSLLVIFVAAVSESWTMPMTGRLDCGVRIIRGTIIISWISAFVSRLWGTWRFISSPSKSAL